MSSQKSVCKWSAVGVLIALLHSPGFAQQSLEYAPSLESVSPTTGSTEFIENLRKETLGSKKSNLHRTPAMIGDFYSGNSLRLSGNANLDRLFVFANDLDVPLILPAGNSVLSITEPGPVGIFASTLNSVQDIQLLLRTSQPLPPALLVGTVADNASFVSQHTVSQIQTSLAATGASFDIIRVAEPGSAYQAAVETAFRARNSAQGTSQFDSLGSGAILQGGVDTLNGGEDLDAFYFYDYIIRINANLADSTSGGVGRMKFAEGGTVLPQDRIFFRHNYLSGVRYSDSRMELNRFVFGFERAMLDGLFSLEMRAPFATDAADASTLDGTMLINGEHTRFGNLTFNLKTLLIEWKNFALSGGLGIGLPSAQDVTVQYADGTPLLRVANESVRLQPFIGALFSPSERWTIQSVAQFDTAANGNTVFINSNGTGLNEIGRVTDSSNLFLDLAANYWLYRSNDARGLTGIIPTLEIHHNVALQDEDVLSAGPFQLANGNAATSLTNLVVGNTLEFGGRTNATVAYTTPIGGGSGRQFQNGLQLFLSRGW